MHCGKSLVSAFSLLPNAHMNKVGVISRNQSSNERNSDRKTVSHMNWFNGITDEMKDSLTTSDNVVREIKILDHIGKVQKNS